MKKTNEFVPPVEQKQSELKKLKPMLESKVQKTVCDRLRKEGWKVYPWSSRNFRSVPDRICVLDVWHKGVLTPRIVFIEFKRPKKDLTVKQRECANDLKGMGCEVIMINNIKKGLAYFGYV